LVKGGEYPFKGFILIFFSLKQGKNKKKKKKKKLDGEIMASTSAHCIFARGL
jgi:hypothetical protein